MSVIPNAADLSNYTTTYHVNGVIFGMEAATGVFLNLICLTYFMRQKQTATRFLYQAIAITDFCIGVSRFFNCIDLLGDFFGLSEYLCPTIGRLDMLLIAVSIYLIMVLSVLRAVCIFNPMRRYTVPLVRRLVLGYIFFYLFLGLVPVLRGSYLEYNRKYRFCGYRIPKDGPNFEVMFFYVFMWYIPTFLTAIPILVSMAITLRAILRDGMPGDHENRVLRERVEAGKTVVLLTVIYVVCNIVPWIQVHFFFRNKGQEWTFQSGLNIPVKAEMWFYWFAWKHLVVLNSIANSFAYFYRIRRLRMYAKRVVTCRAGNIFKTTMGMSSDLIH